MLATGPMSRMKLKLSRIERRVDCVCRDNDKERVAVRRRFHHDFRADIAGGARSVFNDELLAKSLRQPLTNHARDDVGRTTGRKTDDDAYRPRRIRLRPSEARPDRECGSTHGQMPEAAAGKFHDHPPKKCAKDLMLPEPLVDAKLPNDHCVGTDLPKCST
jgi:hypothetical protein